MKKKLKNEILVKQSFSKVKNIVECIVNTTIHALRGGGKNLGGKSLVSAKNSFKTILIGLLISLLAMQCSKGSDPAVTPVAVNGTCQSGQTMQADGTCKAPDGTITCPVGKTKDASGTGTCADISTFKTTCGGQIGLTGPSVMMFKYLNKTDPNPTSLSSANAEVAFIVARGCEENNPTWLSSQSIFSALAYFEIKNNFSGTTINSLSFISNPWDANFVTIGSSSGFPASYIFDFVPKNISNIKNGTGFQYQHSIYGNFLISNCIRSDCFVRINNSIVTDDPSAGGGASPGFTFLTNPVLGLQKGVDINSKDLREPIKYNPLVKNAVNEMFTAYSTRAGVTWSTNVNWRSVLIP